MCPCCCVTLVVWLCPQLDLSQPLEEQGPLDVIIHKLTDLILEADQNDSQSVLLVQRVQVGRCSSGTRRQNKKASSIHRQTSIPSFTAFPHASKSTGYSATAISVLIISSQLSVHNVSSMSRYFCSCQVACEKCPFVFPGT